jgi:hypothetical protein
MYQLKTRARHAGFAGANKTKQILFWRSMPFIPQKYSREISPPYPMKMEYINGLGQFKDGIHTHEYSIMHKENNVNCKSENKRESSKSS